MRKITYTNSVNGLSAEFSSDNPLMHLDLKNFDGSSVGATSVTYKPVEFDGQRVISTNLSARTIILPIQFTAKSNGRYSRAAALDKWTEILKATPHKDHLLDFVRALLASFPPYCTNFA